MANVDEEMEGLQEFELRALWRRMWKQPPPMRLSKDILIRGLAWKLQEQAHGGLGKPELRMLAAMAKAAGDQHLSDSVGDVGDAASIGLGNSNNKFPATSSVPSPITLRESNHLVRDWNGTTHTVLVLASGFEWNGQQFASLSKIAESITGAHWSGPRFFGLVKRSDKVDRSKDQGDTKSFDRRIGVNTASIKLALIEPATTMSVRAAPARAALARIKPSVRELSVINHASSETEIASALNGADHE